MKRLMKHLWITVGAFLFFTVGKVPCSLAESYSAGTSADNTKMNRGDQNNRAVTADHAKQNAPDRELMSQIRKAIVQDGNLSTYAHNVKIIARHGVVTLKGPVKTMDEKQAVLSKAVAIAGVDHVNDRMTIKEKRSEINNDKQIN